MPQQTGGVQTYSDMINMAHRNVNELAAALSRPRPSPSFAFNIPGVNHVRSLRYRRIRASVFAQSKAFFEVERYHGVDAMIKLATRGRDEFHEASPINWEITELLGGV